jgi:predicted phosphodiesterase
MKVQIVSDLHLEFRPNDLTFLKAKGDILVLAGDICPLAIAKDRHVFLAFLEKIIPHFTRIFHVPGNHEYYEGHQSGGFTMQALHKWLARLSLVYPTYTFLNNKVFPMTFKNKTYHFVGATLWTKISEENRLYVQTRMNDYSHITTERKGKKQLLTVEDVNAMHLDSYAFLNKCISSLKNIVLITHHKPFLGEKSSLSEAYESDSTKLFRSSVILAIHGHTHRKYMGKINGVLNVSNPRGYPHERTEFNNEFTVSI